MTDTLSERCYDRRTTSLREHDHMPPVDLRPPPLKVILPPVERMHAPSDPSVLAWAPARHRLAFAQVQDLVQRIWSFPCIDRRADDDWSPDVRGMCRNKVMFLRHFLGGKPIIGRRTDSWAGTLHCALLFKLTDVLFVADYDGVHRLDKYPFKRIDPA